MGGMTGDGVIADIAEIGNPKALITKGTKESPGSPTSHDITEIAEQDADSSLRFGMTNLNRVSG
jgi:hypothetical protein